MGCSNNLTLESQFVGKGRKNIVSIFHSYWPDKARVGMRSLRGSIYSRKNLSKMSNFVEDKNEETMEIADAGQVGNKNPSFA